MAQLAAVALAVMRICLYNPCSANDTLRRKELVAELDVDFLCLLGTQERQLEVDHPVQRRRVQDRLWVTWGWRRPQHVNKSCGISVALRAQWEPYINRNWKPPAELSGRLAALRARAPRHDIVLIAVYLPPRMPENKKYRDIVCRCMEWVRDVLSGLPGRCLPVFMGDFNDQIGMKHDAQAGLVGRPPHGPGQCGRGEEHYASGLLRDLMQAFDLTPIDTLYPIGPTYRGERHSSNIDHMRIPSSALPCIDRFLVPWRSQRRVQNFRTRGV